MDRREDNPTFLKEIEHDTQQNRKNLKTIIAAGLVEIKNKIFTLYRSGSVTEMPLRGEYTLWLSICLPRVVVLHVRWSYIVLIVRKLAAAPNGNMPVIREPDYAPMLRYHLLVMCPVLNAAYLQSSRPCISFAQGRASAEAEHFV